MVAYRFEDSRAGACVARLDGYRGILQVDGYAGHRRLSRTAQGNDGVTLACLLVHVRRKFYELHVADQSATASHTIALMAPLWTLEAEIRGHAPEIRMKTRQDKSAPIVAALFAQGIAETVGQVEAR
jgi:hypothetical protein